ncbi:proton-conducting transporter transmembrane domain-containing protein [Algoriphagus antarcticus]|uniref:Probable inorganic carbon transporter subunit DabB n=1 Tax=Algoriphagus antarcticus TaxID=238540 RepID=A0A3E0DYG7_9BACT|nr:proton-conducting transporter membrane subunit [Algoriphagus antarcticus]REG91001.1 NAD(P)H-quinone oxidoreductase subunit 5 [Algoriphagus antarcticus]
MNQYFLAALTLLSPAVFVATALISWFQSGMRPFLVKKVATAATLISILIAAICGFFVINYGLLETPLLGFEDLGLSIRLDALSILMLAMIALISFIVVRFSLNYLDGDPQQGAFIGRLAATIASVQLLVLSGNLELLFVSWVLTSVSLHRLLVFYKDRPGAIIAARKKFILARLGDICLLAAFVLLYFQFGTGNLEMIFQEIKNNLASGIAMNGIEAVAVLLVSAALLKSAQFPTHGWLIEVMETPTPVSALLHAGLLNAGPFLIIRMAFVMEASTYAPLILIALGGFTALFASVVFLTQTSIKTALGYSSVAHMGFSLLTCGLGLYPAAMLHLVAHSFYKAHAFLSSGSVIEVIRATKVTSAKRIGSPFRIALGIFLALGLYTGFAIVWGIDPEKELSLLALGGIIVMGLSRLFTSALDSSGSLKLILRASILSILVTIAFFTLESGSHYILSSQIPELVRPTFVEIIFITTILLAFGVTVFIQILAPILSATPFYRAMAIHLRNGLYVNTVFDRMVRSLYSHNPENKSIVMTPIKEKKSMKAERFENQPV